MTRIWTDDNFRPGRGSVSQADRRMLKWMGLVAGLFLLAVIFSSDEPAPTTDTVWIDTEYCVPADTESAVGHGLLCRIDPDAIR